MAYQIFISYRREGGEALAYLINEKLSMAGYKVFYDIESLSCGKFNSKLLEVIDECSDVLVILPPHALDRCIKEDDWLRLEISYALKQGKNIVPIMMKGFEWPQELPKEIMELRNYNGAVASFDFFDGVMNRIIKCLSLSFRSSRPTESMKNLKHLLLWGDFDDANLEKIVDKLDLGEGYYIEILTEPVELLSKNLDEIYAIVLIVTDCTKFSANGLATQRVNEALVNYVKKGGRLISAHDVIYRRTKNQLLQDMYGCQITHFQQIDAVNYQKTDECVESGRFASLPEEFVLHDAEICWGDTAEDVDIYFETENGIPLVFSREYGKGICFYLNSGDFKERPPRSILKPEKAFVALLKEMIQMTL